MSLVYGARRGYGQRPDDPGHLISSDDAIRFMSEIVGLSKTLIQEVKEVRNKFHIICDGFKVVAAPHIIGIWTVDGREANSNDYLAKITRAAVELSGGNRTIVIDCEKVSITVTEEHARVTCKHYSATKLHVRNQDGKWILNKDKYGQKSLKDGILQRLEEGLSHERPLTKAEILEKGTPDPHKFDTDDRLTEEDTRGTWGYDNEGKWIRIRDGLLDRIRVDGIVAINPNRTVREATDPSAQEVWFQITCETKTRSIRFVVLSDGEQYHIMSKIGTRYKIVESTQINSLVDAGDMTKVDQTMIKEAMDAYVTSLQLQ